MKKVLLVIFGLAALFQNNSLASNGEKNNFSVVEVVTPAKEIYDDGIYRTQFSSFYVVDEAGNKIISCGEVFDYAAKIKLSEGKYTIFYRNLNGQLVQKELNIERGNCLRIKLD
ncbi:hypothetical protein VJY32_03730 [Ignavibacteria bacterium 4148-Me]|uniref:hypothetical protein n=1 Tax=Rosettibacter primus TaxID=3111523 RepID=UPI00247DC465|nr:hypothetical protein [Ignavibacteria bacterium]